MSDPARKTVILIDALTSDHRIARVQGGALVDVQIDRPGAGCEAGQIILGRVKAVVPGIRGAFLDIGDRRSVGGRVDGFLPFGDKDPEPPVHEGEAVLVQIRTVATPDKGARLTTGLSLTGRYAVYTPGRGGINVSRKGNDPELADRFRQVAAGICNPGDGVIVRTAALQAGAAALEPFAAEVAGLRDHWVRACTLRNGLTPPALVLRTPDAITATLLAVDADNTGSIVVEGAGAWLRIQQGAAPELAGILRQHKSLAPLFEAYGVEQQLDAALGPTVALPSGGRLHIAVTPACVTVDVDSGSASAGGNRRDVIRRSNLEAAGVLARELRLRNLAGKIIVDFISSRDRADGEVLLDQLRTLTAHDPVAVEIKGFSRLGLVELVRWRRTGSLRDLLCDGDHKSARTTAYASLRMAHAEGRGTPGRSVTIRAHAAVIADLKGDLARDVADFSETRGCPLILVIDEAMGLEDTDVYVES